jgi:hypothetical protein
MTCTGERSLVDRLERRTVMCTGNGRPDPPPRRSRLPSDLLQAIDRHPSALGRHLDNYLASVARELRGRGATPPTG